MASVFRRPSSKYYIVCYTDQDGNQRQRSSKSTNKKFAQKLANEIEDAHERQKTADQIRAIMLDLIREIAPGEDAKTGTVSDFCSEWMKTTSREVSRNSIKAYEKHIGRLIDALGAKHVDRVTRRDMSALRNALGMEFGGTTVNGYMKTWRRIFKAAVDDGWTIKNPCDGIRSVKKGEVKEKRGFTDAEYLAAMKATEGTEYHGMLAIGFYTGMRISDVGSLKWSEVDTIAGEIRKKTKKTGQRVVVPMGVPLARAIAELPAGDDPDAPVFPKASASIESTGTSSTISKGFLNAIREAGVNGVSFHSLRVGLVSRLRAAGVSSSVSKDLVAHSSDAIHAVYTKTEDADKRRAINSLPDITA